VRFQLPGSDSDGDIENTCHFGGHWHVVGAFDERIVASACCYLDVANIQGGDLEFRDGSDVGNGAHEVKCETRTGRILAWPISYTTNLVSRFLTTRLSLVSAYSVAFIWWIQRCAFALLPPCHRNNVRGEHYQ